jgi:transcriptional regulator with XRE-family HTH domain
VSTPAPNSLAAKVNALVEERWRHMPKPPGNAAIAKAIRDETGLSISTGYLWMLRTGQRGNPTGQRLQALAKFFAKPPSYFVDQDLTVEDMNLAEALQSRGVRMIALRSDGLSERSQQAILEMIEHARAIERLDLAEQTPPVPPMDG